MINPSINYVTKTPEGGWRVAGSRVSLDSIVHAFHQGRMPESIAAEFPALSLEQVYGAITYYLHCRKEVDAYLETQQEKWRQFQEESNGRHGPLIERIRATGRDTGTNG